jgi:cytosine/uracil/thiamine/allantoin permease
VQYNSQFFSASLWAFAVFSTNISANSTAVANDLVRLSDFADIGYPDH